MSGQKSLKLLISSFQIKIPETVLQIRQEKNYTRIILLKVFSYRFKALHHKSSPRLLHAWLPATAVLLEHPYHKATSPLHGSRSLFSNDEQLPATVASETRFLWPSEDENRLNMKKVSILRTLPKSVVDWKGWKGWKGWIDVESRALIHGPQMTWPLLHGPLPTSQSECCQLSSTRTLLVA